MKEVYIMNGYRMIEPKLEKISNIIYYSFIIILVVLTIWIWIDAPEVKIFSKNDDVSAWFGSDWYICDENFNQISEEPLYDHHHHYLRQKAEDGKLYLRKVVDRDANDSELIIFRVRATDIKLYQNGQLIYENNYRPEYEKYNAKMYLLHMIPAACLKKGDILTLAIENTNYDYFLIQFPALGDRYSLFVYIIGCVKISIIECFLALALLTLNTIASHSPMLADSNRETKSLRWLNSFLFAAIIYLSMDAGFMELFLGKVAVSSWLCSISLMILPMPFIMFIKLSFFPNHARYDVLGFLNFLLVIISVIMFVLYTYNLSKSYMPTHLIIIGGIICCILSFLQEREIPPPEALIGFLSIIGTSLASICTYWKGVVYPASSIFGIGLIVFSLCMLLWTVRSNNEIKIVREMARLEHMKRDKREAEAASEQKSRFLSHMSHEIRTPLNAVLGLNELIMRETRDEKIKKYSEDIQNSGRTLLALINDVLDFSKIENGKLDIVDSDYSLSSVIYDMVLMVQDRAKKKGLELRISVQPDIPDILHGDEIRIKQIIMNLLTNAVKYTRKGWIELSIYMTEVIPYDTNNDKININIKVSDTGIGIKKEELPKLFAEFERLDRNKNRSIEGTGLGLSITSRLIKLMGGTINVESEYEKGSVFIAVIPQKVVSKEPIGDYKQRFESINSDNEESIENDMIMYNGKKMLVIDDNETNLEVITSILEMFEITVDMANCGANGINLASKEKYDLILTDDMMPEMNGTQFMQYIKSHKNEANYITPIVVLTANAIAGAREEYVKSGFDDYMSKPIDIEVLQKILSRFL